MVDLLSFKTNLDKAIEEAVLDVEESNDHILVDIVPNALVRLVSHLRSKKGYSFNTLVDITAVDFPAREQRFEVIYHFLSMTENKRCRVTATVNEGEEVPSITSVFECAN